MLNKNTCIVLWVFDRSDEISDIAYGVYDSYDSSSYTSLAAKEFINQLKDHWTPRFLISLRDEIDKQLERYNENTIYS